MAFYEGIDEEIYEGGDHYVPMAKFRLNQSYTPTTVTPDIVPTSTSYGIPTLYPYVGVGGGDGGYQGGGKWGNLDLSKSKTFDKQVWEVGGPANQYGGWVDKEVTGYYNPTLGQYQTFEGKNINHLGIEVPTIAGALFDKSWGKGPQPGDIKGTFTDGWKSGVENIKEGLDEEKDKWSELLGIDKAKAFFKGKKDQEKFISTAIDTEENQPGGEDTSTITNQSEGITKDIHGNAWDAQSHAQEMAKDQGYATVADYNESIADIRAEGGRVGYNRGRVVNPGGYAGDDEGGILEWIKSKMGSESETNPTVFGTQNSLLNQGSIARLQDAIKSYEALMYMGELDEEQQADYELKLNQLEALEQGAQGQAQGGRVGLRYGGLLSIL
tara:strand:- start:35 stop:1183 length:1149 start_codon:yes stop_codon:yes gene_type:complete